MSDSDSIVTPGTVLADRYKLTEEIGRGGFGMVYLARQLNMDRDVAIKILPPKFMSISDVVARFKREARLASRLRHPNTITVHDYGKHQNLLFIVMEFLEGEDLADVLMRQTTVAMERILHIGRQVLKSLHEAHQHKIIHRDLKPENIFLTRVGGEEDFVKVLDFGIAKLTMPEADADGSVKLRKLTMSGSTVGTPTYMSPEQAAGEEVDGLTDLYALGVILFEMARGRPPFRDDNPVKVMRAHLFEEVPRFPEGPLRDSRFEAVIRKALAKEKGERFESAQDFLEALDVEPSQMLEHLSYGHEPPTEKLHGVESIAEDLNSGELPVDGTPAYKVEGSDAMSPRSPHQTDGMKAAQRAPSPEPDDSVPFDSLPNHSARDRVHEGATSSSLTDSSGLTSRSDLHTPDAPSGFESGASSSSIITVLEPGPEEDVILLTNKKPDGASVERVEAGEANTTSSDANGVDDARAQPSAHTASPSNERLQSSEWSWGSEQQAQLREEDEPKPLRSTGVKKRWIALLFVLLAAAAAGYAHVAGYLELF